MRHGNVGFLGLAAASLAAMTGPARAQGPQSPAANPAAAQELPQVTVIGTTPLSGLGLPMDQIPSNVQTGDSADMLRQQTLGLADYLNASFSGVNVNESASNPLQLDVNYHGFTASPLLGTPEGLSVYVDGVRVNESFGDTVNWDLIPESAISTVTLMPGSNPVFGLNTLGGALSVHTKSGHDNPGSELEAYGGSFGRRAFEGETGGELGAFDYFFTGNYFDEAGWRELSASRVTQGFGKVGWQSERSDVDLSYTYADTHLSGNGAVPLSLLSRDPRASYTPDYTRNLLQFVNLSGTHFLSEKWLLSANLYYRRLTTGSGNGNVSDSYLAGNYAGPPVDCALAPADAVALAYCSPGQDPVSQLEQTSKGFGLQLTDSQDVLGASNQGVIGGDYHDSGDRFEQQYVYGRLAPDRTLIPSAAPFNDRTVIALAGANKILGLYLTDTLSPGKLLHVTVSARYNRNTETLAGYSVDTDLGNVGAGFGQPGPLSGDHTFSRINPAIGLTLTPGDIVTWYANYNEASRAPTVLELGCANPLAPCGLPNDFASDPGLKQVVARTAELGLRGSLPDNRLTFSADVFRTVNSDDIQFVATATNQGYFDNVGATRRQGLDLAIGGKQGGLTWRATYSFVDATFQSNFQVSAQANSSANADGNIAVSRGDRIPLTPRQTGRLVLDYDFDQHWRLGATLMTASGSFLHGNENNANRGGALDAQGTPVLGTGWIPGYTLLNLRGTWHLSERVDVFARVANAFDKRYATAGFLTTNAFNANGSFRPDPADWTYENAVSPGAPRGIWAGARVRFE